MNKGSTDKLEELCKDIVRSKGAQIINKVIHKHLSVSYIIITGVNISNKTYYCGIFPYTASEIFTVTGKTTTRIGNEEDNDNLPDLSANVKVFSSKEDFIKHKYTEEHAQGFEKGLLTMQTKFVNNLVGYGSGGFSIDEASTYLNPVRCLCIRYTYNAIIDGNLVLLFSKDNVITNPYKGEKRIEYFNFVNSLGIPVEWREYVVK